MTLFLDDGDVRLYHGDVLEQLSLLPDGSVDCVVTSPPYWGLRDYGTGEWEGGDETCDHKGAPHRTQAGFNERYFGREFNQDKQGDLREPYRDVCGKCGARRVDQQLGLEPTPDLYVQRMVAVFREVRRVLAAHGTCFVNLGDSYASGEFGRNDNGSPTGSSGPYLTGKQPPRSERRIKQRSGLKPKDLVGIPWRVAFALQADGWCLRSDIVWSKPNPMPESVTDRPTKAHEMVFLLTKAEWKGAPRGRFCDMSESDKRWLALLLDAEGNITVKRVAPTEGKSPQYGAQVAVGSTSRALLDRLQQIVGVGNINEREGTNAPMFYWQASNKVARDLLYALYPHLIVKPRQARIAIHLESLLYHRGNATRRTDSENAALESLWLRNKECNQFGDPDLSDVPEPKYGRWVPNRYFFDQEAVREDAAWERWGDQTNRKHEGSGSAAGWIGDKPKGDLTQRRTAHYNTADRYGAGNGGNSGFDGLAAKMRDGEHRGRNVRSVWTIATQPYPEAHFATYPEELVRRCVLAGCPQRVCTTCGKPSERLIDVSYEKSPVHGAGSTVGRHYETGANNFDGAGMPRVNKVTETTGWSDCGHNTWRPGTVLDPFVGSGTTCKVARDHGRHSIGIDLSADYLQLAARRLQQLSLLTQEGAHPAPGLPASNRTEKDQSAA